MKPKTDRVESIDILRGLVMVIMALDHVRDYFNYGSFFIDPTNVETTTPILFFTRFVTHYCAPVFVFLAGTSAFLYGRNKTNSQLSKFLLTNNPTITVHFTTHQDGLKNGGSSRRGTERMFLQDTK